MPPTSPTPSSPLPAIPGFDAGRAGKRAECDGGGPAALSNYATRQDFTGTLTGDYVDHGDPPWRWYLMTDLTKKPDGYPWDSVWCESESLYLIEGESR
jgi:hypothetical protein